MAGLVEGHPLCYELYAFEGKGQGLRATKRIEEGELIFRECPFIWHSKIGKTDFACHCCGRYLRNTSGDRSVTIVRCNSSPSLCKAVYCTAACEEESLKNGHRFVCAGRSEKFDSYIDESGGDGHMSHSVRLLGVALVFYRRVAEKVLRSYGSSSSSGMTPITALEAATELLQGYQRVDYCRTVHALRCGNLNVDDEMFETMIAPAYFMSHLETPLELIKEISCNQDCWGGGEEGAALGAAFVNSEIFGAPFFRELIGCFSINNLEVRIRDEFAHEAGDSAAPPAAPLVVAGEGDVQSDSERASATIAEYEQGQRHENDATLRGTGLNKLYSRMNHSCQCNTQTACGSRAEVLVYAARPIEEGEEVRRTVLPLSLSLPNWWAVVLSLSPYHAVTLPLPLSHCHTPTVAFIYLFTELTFSNNSLIAKRVRSMTTDD